VHQLETGGSLPRHATLVVIRRALETAGVEFIDENGGGPGTHPRKDQRKMNWLPLQSALGPEQLQILCGP
jgi:hypothetical protein